MSEIQATATRAPEPPLSHDPLSLDWGAELDEREVSIAVPGGTLGARRFLPQRPRAAVVVGHPGALRHLTSRERFAAGLLARAGFATLLVDLLTDDEDARDGSAGEDVPLLALRLSSVGHWLARERALGELPLGYLGVDGAAAAALVAAAFDGGRVFAVVTRGGHPERAGASLLLTHVPTLIIHGLDDVPAQTAFTGARWSAGDSHLRQRLVLPVSSSALGDGPALDRVMSASAAWFTFWLDGLELPRPAPTGSTR
jgi:putative phosphoribosyl transferase